MIKALKAKGCSFHSEGFEGLESGHSYEAFLRSEPANEYDPNAVAVYINEKQVGYLPAGWWDTEKDISLFLHSRIDNNEVSFSAQVTGGFELENGKKANYGVLLYLI